MRRGGYPRRVGARIVWSMPSKICFGRFLKDKKDKTYGLQKLEQMLHQSLQAGGADGAGIEPGLAERLQSSLNEAAQQQELAGEPAVLLTSGMLRPVLSKFLKHSVSGLHVLSYQEIPDDKQIKIVSAVGQ